MDKFVIRVQIAKDANADCFISLHLNYGAYYNDGARGFEIYIKDKEELTTNMAKTLEANLQELNFTQNRGIKTTQENPLLVIDENDIPAMLVKWDLSVMIKMWHISLPKKDKMRLPMHWHKVL